MINFSEYKRARAKHPRYSASTVVAIIRQKSIPPVVELNSSGEGSTEIDGFTVSVEVSHDEYAERDWHGELVCDYSVAGIPRYNLDGDQRDYGDAWRQRNRWHFFVPQEMPDVVARYLNRTCGYSRHDAYLEAWKQAREDYRELTENAQYQILQVLVKVSRNGIDLGIASVGGCEVEDSDSPHIQEMIADLIPEAMADAIQQLDALIASVTTLADKGEVA